jgi:hypothetical protein
MAIQAGSGTCGHAGAGWCTAGKVLLGKLQANLAELNLCRLSRANNEIRILSR